MATAKKKRRAPALTVEARENQLISAAIDLAEKQILDGTASPSVLVHYLKLGSTRTQLENEKLKSENELLKAKSAKIESEKDNLKLYEDALKAFRGYRGSDDDDVEELF